MNFSAVNDDHRCVGETVSEAAGFAHPHDEMRFVAVP